MPKRQPVSVKLKRRIVASLDVLAQADEVSRSHLVELACLAYLKRRGRPADAQAGGTPPPTPVRCALGVSECHPHTPPTE
jgi:hypothetical protein